MLLSALSLHQYVIKRIMGTG